MKIFSKLKKTLNTSSINQAKSAIPDLEVWGDGDTFKLISKASSKSEGWMKSTKAMEIPKSGCVVQVTTQQGHNVAEAVTFVPMVRISDITDKKGRLIGRKLVKI